MSMECEDHDNSQSIGEERNEEVDTGTSGNTVRKRRKTSRCWISFRELPLAQDQTRRAKCVKCGSIFKCDNRIGTSSMVRHHDECWCSGTLLSPQSSTQSSNFSHDKFFEMLFDAIVQHDLSFSFVEYKGFRELFHYISPSLKLPCRNTVKAHVSKLYEKEKLKLRGILGAVQGRICLTSDLWTSQTTDGYLTLTAHWVDEEWQLQKRIISFCRFPPPHNGVALAEKINALIVEWEIEKKLFSITLDNASANDSFVDRLRIQLNFRGLLVLGGKYFHIRCCAHILNLIVQVGLKSIEPSVGKIRECLKYIKGSMARKQRFRSCVEQVGLGDSTKTLRQDVPTRWNSTHLMLESVIFYKRALINFELVDMEFKCCPSLEEWVKIEKISKFLKIFYDVTSLFSGTKYPTSNLFFPKILMIRESIRKAMNDEDPFMNQMGMAMNNKFAKYWSDYSLILGLCIVLDPQYKMALVEWSHAIIYGDNSREFKTFMDDLTLLFEAYVEMCSSENASGFSNEICSQSECEDEFLWDFHAQYRSCSTSSNEKTELQKYLEEERYKAPQNFKIFNWWKCEQIRYPVLGRMARDLLTILISTVASESAFSIAGRILDQNRSSLLPKTVEELICYRDWLGDKKDEDHIDWAKLGEDVLDLTI